MAKPEWGAKRSCPSCGTRFYDLMRDPVPCPSCGTTYELSAFAERKTSQPSRVRAKPEKAAPVPAGRDDDEDDSLVEDDSDSVDDAVLLDDEEEDDDDDLGEIGVAGEGDDDDS